MTIKNLLDDKGYGCLDISPESTIENAAEKMMEHHVGCLLVTADDKPLGIITERDLMYTICHEHRDVATTQVAEVMSKDPVTFDVSGTVRDAMSLMFHNETGHRVRHLPIMDGDKLVGMVSISDLLRRIIQETEFENRIMKNYIQNWPEEEVT